MRNRTVPFFNFGIRDYYSMPGPVITNRSTTRFDPRRGSTHYHSNAGRIDQVIDPFWNQTLITFSNEIPVQRTDALLQTRTMTYDTNGNLVRLTREDGSVRAMGYDARGRLTALTNAIGGVLRFQYDARGNPTNWITPAGRTVEAEYDTRGLITRLRLPGNRIWQYRYDTFGNATNIVDPAGGVWVAQFNAHGLRPVLMADPMGMPMAPTYDNNDRLTTLTFADGRQRRFVYDCCAWSQFVDERGFTNTVERNAWQFVTRRTDPLGRQVNYTFDDRNNLTRITYPDGTADRFAYDALDRLVSATNRSGGTSLMTYDALGRVTSLTNERSGGYQFEYDAVGRLTAIQYPNYEWQIPPTPMRYSREEYQYDALGRLTNQTLWGNPYSSERRDVSLAYDPDGLVTAKYHNGAIEARYTYDAGGALVEYSDGLGTTRRQRDAMQRVTNIVYPDGFAASFDYNAAGFLTSVSYPGGPVVTYGRDQRHRITSMAWDGQSIQFQLDAAGNVTNEIRSNGTDSYRVFDGAGQLTRLRHRTGTNVLVQLRYERDIMGRTTNLVKESGILAVTPVFNSATNRAQYDLGDELTNWNGGVVQRDWRGGMVTNIPGRSFAASYDAEARMVGMNVGGTNATYAYDGLGERVRATVGGRTKVFHHDALGRLLFETENGNVTARYFWRDGALVAMWRDKKGYFFYHHDAIGSTLALTDAQGRPAAIYRYTPYGQVASAFARVENPFTYVGRYGVMNEGGGIFFMRSRFYDAVAGRFLTRDPIGLAAGPNMYSYVRGNPLDGVDPDGEEILTVAVGGAILVAATIYGVWQIVGRPTERISAEAAAFQQRNVFQAGQGEDYLNYLTSAPTGRPDAAEVSRLANEAVRTGAEMSIRLHAEVLQQTVDPLNLNATPREALQTLIKPAPLPTLVDTTIQSCSPPTGTPP